MPAFVNPHLALTAAVQRGEEAACPWCQAETREDGTEVFMWHCGGKVWKRPCPWCGGTGKYDPETAQRSGWPLSRELLG